MKSFREKRAGGAAPCESGLDVPSELLLVPGAPVRDRDLPRVSIVILNLNGRHHLRGCFESLSALDYPEGKLEVLLIDNASSDGSVEEMKTHHQWVRLFVNERNVGFAAGCNQGARSARGPEVLCFLNNDIRVDPKFLRELVGPLVRGECQATTAKMLSWDGEKINSAGGGMNFHGIGVQRGYLEKPSPIYDVPLKTLFACGGAMAIDARVFQDVGGFDEEFFAYYEDVDLGWRMWVLGHACHYVPTSVCYHHHSSTSRRLRPEMLRVLQIRNPLLACFKNYDDENLRAVMPALLGLAVRRMWNVSGLSDDRSFRIEYDSSAAKGGGVRRVWNKARWGVHRAIGVRREAAADLIAMNDLLGRWDHWMRRRTEIQSRRARTDAEIFRMFLKPHWCIGEEPGYRELHRGLSSFLGLDRLFPPDDLPEPKH